MGIVTNCGKYEIKENEQLLTLLENDTDLAWLDYQIETNKTIDNRINKQ